MTRPRDPRRPSNPLLPPVDDAPGPMPPLSAAESDAIAWSVVSRWAALPPGLDPLDEDLGPSQPLTAQASARLAQHAVRIHARRKHVLHPWAQRAAVAALCLLGAASVSFAAYKLWSATSTPLAPQAQNTRSIPPTAVSMPVPQPAAVEARAPALQPEAAEPTRSEQAPNSTKPSTTDDPEALLARANALRAKRKWAAAETTYRQVAGEGANKAQRYVALVAAASIAHQHLDKPARALSLYQSALALVPNGNLSEQALFGTAECYRTLGSTAAELGALQQLSTEHPKGLFTAAAQRRLAELESSPAER